LSGCRISTKQVGLTSASENGVLAYMTNSLKNRLVWLDRTGREITQVSAPDYLHS
jgi:hypothetical protein